MIGVFFIFIGSLDVCFYLNSGRNICFLDKDLWLVKLDVEYFVVICCFWWKLCINEYVIFSVFLFKDGDKDFFMYYVVLGVS